jgi:hypothetical protein
MATMGWLTKSKITLLLLSTSHGGVGACCVKELLGASGNMQRTIERHVIDTFRTSHPQKLNNVVAGEEVVDIFFSNAERVCQAAHDTVAVEEVTRARVAVPDEPKKDLNLDSLLGNQPFIPSHRLDF